MNSRNLRVLSAAAVLIVLAALWLGHSRSPQGTEQQSLYPDLKGKLEAVTGVLIFKAGDQLATELSRDGSAWKVKQRFDYPADTSKVNSLLINLEGALLREQKTANPANYAALAVQDLTDNATTGVRVELGGTPSPVKLIVGKHDQAARATYVRRAGEPQSWLVGSDLEIAADPTQWLKHEIVNVGADRIQDATVLLSGQSGSAAPYTVFKNARADANFDVKGIPKGREVNSIAAANSAAQALTSLQLEDVRPLSELANEKNTGRAIFHTFDGLAVECVGYSVGEKRWIAVKASFDPDLAKRFQLPVDPSKTVGNDKPAVANDASLDALIKKGQEEAAAINSATSKWAYALPTFKYDTLFKPLEDLLKKPEMLKKGK